jgi:hypothetical protein
MVEICQQLSIGTDEKPSPCLYRRPIFVQGDYLHDSEPCFSNDIRDGRSPTFYSDANCEED